MKFLNNLSASSVRRCWVVWRLRMRSWLDSIGSVTMSWVLNLQALSLKLRRWLSMLDCTMSNPVKTTSGLPSRNSDIHSISPHEESRMLEWRLDLVKVHCLVQLYLIWSFFKCFFISSITEPRTAFILLVDDCRLPCPLLDSPHSFWLKILLNLFLLYSFSSLFNIKKSCLSVFLASLYRRYYEVQLRISFL